MSALTIPISILQSNTAVAAMVGRRVYPVDMPQESDCPAIVVTPVRLVDDLLLQGQAHYPVIDIITDAVANDWRQCDELGDLIKDALIDFHGNAAGYHAIVYLEEIDFTDRGEDGERWRRRIAWSIRYRKN